MKPKNPNYREKVTAIFSRGRFINDLGIEVADMGPGWCETKMAVREHILQQDGYVHAGVLASMADHTAGGATGTLVAEEEIVLTVEFKINFLRPAVGDALRCRAKVLKGGRTLIVAESEVFISSAGHEKMAAKAMVTLTAVKGSAS